MRPFTSWLRQLKSGFSRPAPRQTISAKARSRRPLLEQLEDRVLLAIDLTLGLTGNEPTIAVDPNNNSIVAVARFRTVLISSDSGQTFPTTVNVAAPNGYADGGGDASLSFDGQGNLFYGYLASNLMPANPNFKTGVFAAQINPMTGMVTQNQTVAVETPNTNDHDKEWIAADHWAGSAFQNNVYLIWTRLGGGSVILFSRSINGGQNWSAPVQLNGGGEGFVWPSEVNVAPNGDVWVAWHTHTDETAGNTGEVRMRRSIDGGANFQAELANLPFTAGTADLNDNSGPVANGGSGNPRVPRLLSWLQGSVQPRILTDPIRPNTIYVVANDDPDNNYAAGDSGDIVFARSTDNGANWTRQTISHAPANTTQIMPSASIDELGNIAVTWYDTRNGVTNAGLDGIAGNADDDFLLDVFGTVSTDGGLTFCTTDFQINDTAFDPDNSPGNRPTDRFPGNNVFRIGEYNGLAAANGIASAVWTGNVFSGMPVLPTGQQTYFDTFAIVTRVTAPGNQNAVEGASKSFSLGSFGDVCGGSWSVDVDWDDGTAHTTFTAATAGTLAGQNHTYAEEGNYTVKVKVTDTGAGETDSDSKTFQVAVSDPAVTATGGFAFLAVEGSLSGTQTVATFTDPGGSEPLADYSADIAWGDGNTTIGAVITFDGVSTYTVSGAHLYGEEGTFTITTTIHHDVAPDAVTTSTATVSDPAVVATGVPVFAVTCLTKTLTLATFTDPGGPEPNPSDPGGTLADHYKVDSINWGDSTPLDTTSGAITFDGVGTFTVKGMHAYADEGVFTVTVTLNHEGIITTVTTTATIKDDIGLLLLDPTGSKSLMVTGNGIVNVTGCGVVVVDSSDSSAAFVTGNGSVTAQDIDVTGGVKLAGHGTLSVPPEQEPATADPLGLGLPVPPSPIFAAVNYSGSAPLTLNPGTYVGGIKITGNGNVTLNPGVYYMQGGGFSVTGKGSVTGSNVMIVNAPSNSSDKISISGQGSVTLSGLTSGPYQGIVILQDPSSGNTVSFTGKGAVSLTGVAYVPHALVQITGQGNVTINPGAGTAVSPPPILGALIAFDLKVDGNGILTINPDPTVGPVKASGGAAAIGGSVVVSDNSLRQISLLLQGSPQTVAPGPRAVIAAPSRAGTIATSQAAVAPVYFFNTGSTAVALSGATAKTQIPVGFDPLSERLGEELAAN